MRSRSLLGLTVAVAASLMSASAAPAASRPPYDPDLVTIAAPHTDTVVKRSPVRLSFRAAHRARAIRAYVGERRIRSLKHRGPRYTANVSVRGLRPGPHHLLVTSRARGKRDTDAVTFFIVRRRPRLLTARTVKVARPHEVSVPLSLRLRSTPRRVDIMLNGRDASRGLWPLVGRSRSGRLSAAQGLRFGRNRLIVRALKLDGSYDVERRVIHVPRRTPLASAGQNRHGTVRSRIRLSGHRSQATTTCGRRLAHSWKIVRAPRRSKAKLRAAHSSRSVIKPDRPGQYRVRLTVRERGCGRAHAAQAGGRTASDTMVLDAAPNLPPIGWPIDTIASQGGQTGISYGPNFAAGGPSQSLQILVLNRTDLTTDQTPDTNFYDLSTSAGVGQLTTALQGLKSTSMVVLAGGTSMTASTLPQVNTALEQIGVSALPSGTSGPWSAIGVPGAAPESMFLNFTGALTGYIQKSWTPTTPPDTSDRNLNGPGTPGFSFVYGNYQPFALTSSSTSATITLGPTSLTLPYASGYSGGALAAVVVDGQTLQPVGPPQNTASAVYYVNDPARGQEEQGRLLTVLSAYQDRPGALLAMQSIGTVTGPFGPGGRGTNPQWSGLSASMGAYGATQHLFNTISGGYSFVGGTSFSGPAAETSTNQSGLTSAQLNGVLGMSNELSTFEPFLHDPLSVPSGTQQDGQGFDYSLLTLAYQPAQPWPGDGDPQYEAAYTWIGNESGVPNLNPDLRSAYVNNRDLDDGGWSDQIGYLKEVDCPSGRTDFPQDVCQAVVNELILEVGWISPVIGFFKNAEAPLTLASGASFADLSAQLVDIEKDFYVPPSSDVAGEVLDVLSEAFDLASYFSGETIEPVLGAVGAMVGGAAAMTTNSDGSSVMENLQFDEAQLAVQLEDSYLETALAYGQIEDMILSDYGKLKALGTAIGSNDQRYTWSNSSIDDAVSALQGSAYRWGWGKLLPLAYSQRIVPNVSPDGDPVGEPQNWPCDVGGSVPRYIFNETPADGTGWFKAYTATGSTVGPVMWIVGNETSSDGVPAFQVPSATVTDAMNSSFNHNPLLQAQFWAREFNPQPLGNSFLNACSQGE